MLTVDALAQEIRRVDGSNSLGAGALAEALMPFLSATPANPAQGISARVDEVFMPPIRQILADFAHSNRMASVWSLEAKIEAAITAAIGAGGQAVAGQHVAYFDDGEFHWMSGIAPRNCELYTHPAPSGQAVAADIGDAVLAWMVKYDLLDAGNEYHAADVLAVLDYLAPAERSNPPAQPGWREESRFHLEWIGAPRPPVHPNPMTGRQSFETLESAIAFMQRQPADAQFVSLREFVTTKIDRTGEVRDRAIPASHQPGDA